jgi:hypothetical protein
MIMDLQLQKLTQKYEQPPFVSFNAAIEIKSREQAQLDAQKEAYFRNGGKVTSYDNKCSVVVMDDSYDPSKQMNARRNSHVGKRDLTSLVAYHSRKKPEKKRLNITEKKLVSKTVYSVNVAGVFYGSHATEEIAVRIRDEKRKLLNLPAAEY